MKVDHVVFLVMLVGYNIVYAAFTTEKEANIYKNFKLNPEEFYVVPIEVWG